MRDDAYDTQAVTLRVPRPWDRDAERSPAGDEQATEPRADTLVDVDPELLELEEGDAAQPGLEAVFDDPRRGPLRLCL